MRIYLLIEYRFQFPWNGHSMNFLGLLSRCFVQVAQPSLITHFYHLYFGSFPASISRRQDIIRNHVAATQRCHNLLAHCLLMSLSFSCLHASLPSPHPTTSFQLSECRKVRSYSSLKFPQKSGCLVGGKLMLHTCLLVDRCCCSTLLPGQDRECTSWRTETSCESHARTFQPQCVRVWYCNWNKLLLMGSNFCYFQRFIPYLEWTPRNPNLKSWPFITRTLAFKRKMRASRTFCIPSHGAFCSSTYFCPLRSQLKIPAISHTPSSTSPYFSKYHEIQLQKQTSLKIQGSIARKIQTSVCAYAALCSRGWEIMSLFRT